MQKVNYEILKGHFEHCIRETMVSNATDNQDKKIDELFGILDKILQK